jgi:hypothetical protein
VKRWAFLTVLFLAALVAGGASAQTVTLPTAEEAAGTVVQQVEAVVGQATGSGSSGPGSSSSSSGSSASSGSSSSGGSAGTTASSSGGNAHECPPDRQAVTSGGTGSGSQTGGDGDRDGGATLAARRGKSDSRIRQKRVPGAREIAAGGVLAETVEPIPDETRRESAPAVPVVVREPEGVPLSVGLAALALTGVAFAGIVAGVTSHVLGSRAR